MGITSHRPAVILLALVTLLLTACGDPTPPEVLERSRQMPAWYDEAKLGVFIHWGPASVPAFAVGGPLQPGELEEVLLGSGGRKELPYAEWYQYALNVPGSETAAHHKREYGDAPYTDFSPVFEQRVAARWDAAAWAELFHQAGARYVVLVTKHHDGYALWPSQVENPYIPGWNSTQDLVGELAAAVRERGMRFGTYYSTGLDWSFELVSEGDLVRDVMRSAPGSQAYADYTFAQLTELIERYAPDILWADIGYPSRGRLGELLHNYFAAVPDGVVNDRWGGVDVLGTIAKIPGATWVMKALGRWMLTGESEEPVDDPKRLGFKTAEYDSIPAITSFKWEATRGLGASFAYNEQERPEDFLDTQALVQYLVDTVAKNGNVLINVGPDSYGQIPAVQEAPLRGLGEWLAVNGEAIYDTSPWQRFSNQSGRDLRYTQRSGVLYATVFGPVGSEFRIEHPGVDLAGVSVLGAGVANVEEEGDVITVSLTQTLNSPAAVVRYELE